MPRDLLLEIGSEEIPAAELDAALTALPERARTRLVEARLEPGAITVWGTPRRIAVRVAGILDRQPDLEETLTGPPERVAYKEGSPTQAAVKFAEKAGVTVDDLLMADTPKGRYVTARRVLLGAPAEQILPEVCIALIEGLSWRKSMRWADRPERFVRPVRWIVALLGGDVLPISFAGVTAGRDTHGHRFHAPDGISLATPAEYEAALERARVLPNRSQRRGRIAEQIADLEAKEGARILPDEALLDEVTNLVEWPVAVCGGFDERFLEVPREVIISAMRGHQRYFAMERDGALVNRFVTVLGTEVRDLDVAVQGNQRVLAARLSDARFFWDEDRKEGLSTWAEALGDVVYQAKLGTLAEKVARLVSLGEALAPVLGADPEAVVLAARLCKADLVTHMVGEFPDLQGVMGRYYALAEGHAPVVGEAILEHYLPRGASGDLPPSAEGAALALADRLDTLVGGIGAGLKPKGGGDPFGLRRAALGLLRILLERRMAVRLGEWVGRAAALHDKVTPDAEEVVGFVLERLRGLLSDRAPGEVVQAVLAAGGDDPVDLADRVEAVAAFAETPDYAALATAFRRMNILKQADVEVGQVDPGRLSEEAERALWAALGEVTGRVDGSVAAGRYGDALGAMAGLRTAVDRFFDEVKVLDDDPAMRANRLALVAAVDALFRRVADFKRIAS